MMRSSPSSSCSNSSSSATSLTNRLETIFKKASEVSILCEIEVCVIHYAPNGELKTWPEDREKVKDIALRYSQLDEAKRRKKRVNLYEFLNKKKKVKTNLKKKAKMGFIKEENLKKNVNGLKYPISDHYSPDQISQLIQSLEESFSTLQERLRFVETQKQNETKLDQDHQTQSFNPSRFSLFMYNHGDDTFSQIPLSASNYTQDYYALLQDYGLKKHLMKQDLCGYDQNMCVSNITKNNFQHPSLTEQESELKNQFMQKEFCGFDQSMCIGNINSNNFQYPCVSNTQDYYGLDQLMQHELNGYDQNMCMSDMTNNNLLSNTVLDEFCSDFLDPNGNSSFFQDMSSRYANNFDESSLLRRSTLPSFYTIPNSCFLSDNAG